ncbi:hypothetical protein [Olsenella uli]|uniref:hypothetical protein n=1 Tax=Olsenella uli TaxID=133926 RepID=UPI0004534C11|nr:hypothetical protein [Olsenella uli]EUB30420.1 hypothetical protein HMPREF1503_0894 [Olsenella uli MSTE5]
MAGSIYDFTVMAQDGSEKPLADVNGGNESPLYAWLKGQRGGVMGSKIKWNFTRFLVDCDGRVVERFAPTKTPEDIDASVAALL